MNFEYPTYIVLELPNEISDKVMSIRKSHKDVFRSALPVEITVVGSSGVGTISKGQDEQVVFSKVNDIAKKIKPFKLSFKEVKRFPGTDIFVLKVKDETKIREIHELFKTSGFKLDEISSEFEPHCTLRSRSPITQEDEEELFNITIEDEFVVDTLSVYMLNKLPIKLLHSVKLTGSL